MDLTNEKIQPSCKKYYHEPTLRVYGDIRVMTQSVATGMGHNDATPGRKT